MQNLTSILLTVAGIALLGLFGFVTLSLLMVLAGVLSLTLLARAMMPVARPVPVKARHNSRQGGHDVRRIWNDGKGTIIDM
nr:hypothetical protein [uncultured Gellertiella sp.]